MKWRERGQIISVEKAVYSRAFLRCWSISRSIFLSNVRNVRLFETFVFCPHLYKSFGLVFNKKKAMIAKRIFAPKMDQCRCFHQHPLFVGLCVSVCPPHLVRHHLLGLGHPRPCVHQGAEGAAEPRLEGGARHGQGLQHASI